MIEGATSRAVAAASATTKIVLRLLLAALVTLLSSSIRAGTPATIPAAPSGKPSPNATGPTIRLHYNREAAGANPVSSFMYFIPLISPEPVTWESRPGSTQMARVTSASRKSTPDSFLTKCEFEFIGDGWQQSVFDLTNQIRRNEKKLKSGATLQRQLTSITVAGPGSGVVEAEGVITNGIRTVTEVRLHFNARGKASPISIGLCDIKCREGNFEQVNEIVARVNTLKFRRQPGRPKMEVTLASVNDKAAGRSIWQSIKGSMKGMAANLFIPPLTVDATGHRTMLDFGRALTAGETTFTFPRAKNLKNSGGTTALAPSR